MKIKHSIKLLPDTKQPDVYISWQGVKILITYGRDGHTKWHFKRQFAALSLLLYITSFSDHLTESHWFSKWKYHYIWSLCKFRSLDKLSYWPNVHQKSTALSTLQSITEWPSIDTISKWFQVLVFKTWELITFHSFYSGKNLVFK